VDCAECLPIDDSLFDALNFIRFPNPNLLVFLSNKVFIFSSGVR